DDGAMEELRRVEGAESKRTRRVDERLCTAAVAGERPGEDVVAVDRGTLVLRDARQRHGPPQCNPVIDVEQRDLQVDVDAVHALKARDRADECVLPLRGGL